MACNTCGRTDGYNVFSADSSVTCRCGRSPKAYEICSNCAGAFPTRDEGEGHVGVLCPHCNGYIGVIKW